MKLMLISDIHGSPAALEKAFALADKEGAGRILILGDLLNHGPRNPLPEGYQPQRVAELLNQNAGRITCVRGNCDSEVDQMLVSVPVLGEYAAVLIDGRQMFLTHGHIYNPDNLPELGEGDIFCFGHTHIPLLDMKEGRVMFNPGSIALPKGGHQPTVGWYDNGRLSITNFEGKALFELNPD